LRRKGKYQDTTQNKLDIEPVGLLLGLLFGYLEYFLDLRPKLTIVGLYALGFVDCLLLVLSTLLLIVFLKNHSTKGKKRGG